jgi:hypothetical protein
MICGVLGGEGQQISKGRRMPPFNETNGCRGNFIGELAIGERIRKYAQPATMFTWLAITF